MRRLFLPIAGLAAAAALGAVAGCSKDDNDASTTTVVTTTETSHESTTTVERTPIDGFTAAAVRVVDEATGEVFEYCVMIADTDEERAQGLMYQTDLGGFTGMLFVFESISDGGFWMKNTLLPLTVIYFDVDGAYVSEQDMEPCPPGTDCPSYPPEGPYLFALEVPQGTAGELGINDRSRLEIGGTCTS